MRLVIVAEHPLTAETIRRGLRHVPSCRVVGFVDARRSCIVPVANAHPDVVLVDEPADRDATLSCIRDLRAAAPEAKVLLLARDMEPAWLSEAATAGIDAAIMKTSHLESLGLLVREIVSGHVFHAFTNRPAPAQRNDGAAEGLTGRELEILRLVAAGASNGRIAGELWVTEQTVKFHLSNIYRKLGVANRTEAGHYAHVNGFLEPAAAPPAVAAPVRLAVAA